MLKVSVPLSSVVINSTRRHCIKELLLCDISIIVEITYPTIINETYTHYTSRLPIGAICRFSNRIHFDNMILDYVINTFIERFIFAHTTMSPPSMFNPVVLTINFSNNSRMTSRIIFLYISIIITIIIPKHLPTNLVLITHVRSIDRLFPTSS